MKKDKEIKLKEIVYNSSGKPISKILEESFLTFYFTKPLKNSVRQH